MPGSKTKRMALMAVFLAAFSLLPVHVSKADTPTEVRIISTDVGNCLLAEVIINGVLVGQALETRDGYLSRLDEGFYPATAQYFPPDLLLIERSANLADSVRLVPTTEGATTSAKTLSANYKAVGGKGLSHDLLLAPAVDTQTCDQSVSAVPKISGALKWTDTAFFEQLYKNVTPDNTTGTFRRAVNLSVERPLGTEFRENDHIFRRMGGVWSETKAGAIVAQYDETERNLAGFNLLDRKPATVTLLGSSMKVPRIVHAPSGFQFWLSGNGRQSIQVYRPTDEILLTGARSDIPSPLQSTTLAVKSFIREIVVEPVVDGQPVPAATSKRLGFEDMVGGRNSALAFAMLTDQMFSELPNSDDAEIADFRLWSRVKARVECASDTIKSFQPPNLETKYGKEGALSSEGRISKALVVSETKGSAGILALNIRYEVSGRPNVLTLPAFIAVRPRSCNWIWHAVDLRLQCVSGRLVTFPQVTGSDFPSRRSWINHKLADDFDQNPFDRLWVCDAADSSRVR